MHTDTGRTYKLHIDGANHRHRVIRDSVPLALWFYYLSISFSTILAYASLSMLPQSDESSLKGRFDSAEASALSWSHSIERLCWTLLLKLRALWQIAVLLLALWLLLKAFLRSFCCWILSSAPFFGLVFIVLLSHQYIPSSMSFTKSSLQQ